jgi:RNA-directed DNA polymerase
MGATKPFHIPKQLVVEAWKRVRANSGTFGIDKQSITEFEINLKNNLYIIWNRMSSGCYFPPEVRAVDIPKKSGGVRALGIPTVSDRIAQMIAKLFVEDDFEKIFLEDSYAYRKRKSAHDAIKVTQERCWKNDWVVEFDIKGLFDNISHALLLKAVRKHVSTNWVILYIERWLKAGMINSNGDKIVREKGTPQGGVISPLLANLFLHYAFDSWMKREFSSLSWCRYADDGLIHCSSLEQSKYVMDKLSKRFEECSLALHKEKTHIIYCKDSNRKEKYFKNDFDFLGFKFRRREAYNAKTKSKFLSFLPAISSNSLKKIKEVVKYEIGLQRKIFCNLIDIAHLLNPKIRGWINYYSKFYPTALSELYRYINDRICRWAKKKFKSLRKQIKASFKWLKAIYSRNHRLFEHWKVVGMD